MQKSRFQSCFLASCLSLLCFSVAPAGLASFTVAEQDAESIQAQTAEYSLTIRREPYSLTVLREGRLIAGQPPGGGSAFVRKGARFTLGRVESFSTSAEGLVLKVQSGADGVSAEVRLTLFEDNILVSWGLSNEQPCDRLEESYQLASSGHWYGGNVTSGHHWPLETAEIELDPFLASSNQTAPFWLTSSGAGFFIQTYQPLGFSIGKQGDGLFRFNIKQASRLEYRIIAGKDIVQAYDSFTALAGRPSAIPPKGYFSEPIFNTWIELKKEVNQLGVLNYARTLRDKGFGCEVFMIDDMWQSAYGDHTFNAAKFPDPKTMIDSLHALGFKVILWEVPFVDFDARNFEPLKKKGFLVLDSKEKKPCRVSWWNGESSLVDLSNPEAFQWFVGQLKNLQERYGVDGFKLDAGDAEYYDPAFRSFGNVTPNRYTDLFAAVGSYFAINELRVSWLVQGLGLVERLRDKNNDWNRATGLGALIPHGLTESLIGYAYFCPDIIGGGEGGDFEFARFKGMDPELFVRWTEASALMPMMQFSYAPWNLDEHSAAICLRYAKLHSSLGDYIYGLALEARRTGRPVIRPLFFRNPEDERTYTVSDQFLLGERLLVAPVFTKGAVSRDIYLPSGLWKDFWSGEIFQGGKELKDFPAPLDKLPVFVSLD